MGVCIMDYLFFIKTWVKFEVSNDSDYEGGFFKRSGSLRSGNGILSSEGMETRGNG